MPSAGDVEPLRSMPPSVRKFAVNVTLPGCEKRHGTLVNLGQTAEASAARDFVRARRHIAQEHAKPAADRRLAGNGKVDLGVHDARAPAPAAERLGIARCVIRR